MKVTPVPAGYATVTPYLVVPDALALFTFLTNAIGATEVRRTSLPNGSVLNIEMRIGSSMIMLVQGRPEHEVRKTAFYVYVPNVDEAHARGVAAGGVSTMEPADQFYGDRGAGFRDPAGNDWWLASRIEDLSSEELARRVAALDFKPA
jgi:PhnB protein